MDELVPEIVWTWDFAAIGELWTPDEILVWDAESDDD